MIRSKVNGLVLQGYSEYVREVVKLGGGKFAEAVNANAPVNSKKGTAKAAVKKADEKKASTETEVL